MCPMRQTVFIALLHTLTVLPFFDHERSQAPASTDPSTVTESGSLVGRFLQFRRRIGCKPAPALSFRPWPFSRAPGCKPANPVRTKVRTFCVAAIPHRPALTGPLARCPAPPGANRKPCKPCFLVGRWRNAALAPPAWRFGQEGPLLPGRGGGRRSPAPEDPCIQRTRWVWWNKWVCFPLLYINAICQIARVRMGTPP